MTKRTKKTLLTALVIIAIIAAIWLLLQIVLPFLFNAFLLAIEKILAPIVVIIVLIFVFFMAIDN